MSKTQELNLGSGRKIKLGPHNQLEFHYTLDCNCMIGFLIDQKELKKIQDFFANLKCNET